MFVSIIVPVYNVKDYIIKCLESISRQTFDDYEVIVVDDGSTDGCSEMVDHYCRDKSKFIVYHKENGGLMSAWMYGVERANGEYIGFVDSDDYIAPEMYEVMAGCVKQYHADIALCNHYYDSTSIDGQMAIHRNPISDGFYEGNNLKIVKQHILPRLGTDYVSPSRCTKLINIDLLKTNLKYCDQRISSAEDVNSMVPCLLGCKSLVYVDKPLYYYVKRKTSISNVFKDEILDTYSILIQNLSSASEDWKCNLHEQCANLYNFYGVLWCLYVYKSELCFKNKVYQIYRLLKNKNYIQNAKNIITAEGMVANIYKIMVLAKNPKIFLRCYRLQQWLSKIVGRS